MKQTPRERAMERAHEEGERRRNHYIRRSSSKKKALHPDKHYEWYNQIPSFYRGSRRGSRRGSHRGSRRRRRR